VNFNSGRLFGRFRDGSKVMHQRLFACLLFGTLLSLPLAASGQDTYSTIAGRIIVSGPSFRTEDPTEASRGTGPSVSTRELSIPQRAIKAYTKGMDRLQKNDPAGSLDHFRRAASEFPDFYEAYHAMGLAQLRLGHEVEAQEEFQKAIDASGGHYAEPHFGLSALLCSQQKFAEAEPVIRKALELAPGFGPGHFILAWALFWTEPPGRRGKDCSGGVATRSQARYGSSAVGTYPHPSE
jgi:tetratricopeptide (TPR) repeat protein